VRGKIVFPAAAAGALLAGCLVFSQPGSAAATHAPSRHGDTTFAINATASPYNAVCNGSSDDTTAIQSAINAAPSTGAIIEIPHTSTGCKITSTLTLGTNDILEGEGGQTQIWFDSAGNGPAIQFGPTSGSSPTDEHGGGLQDIGIIGNSSTGGYPNQIGIQVSSTVDAFLSDVEVEDTGIGLQVNGGGSSDWDGEGTYQDFMASNVVTGIRFINSGGTETDQRILSGYLSGVSASSGYGIYANGLHSSVFEGYSAETFADGIYLTTGTQDNQLFGGRMEDSGTQNGTTSYMCSGSGVNSVFWGPYDADVTATAVTNSNGASCTSHF
jgi:hypothetical protein